MQRWGCRLVGEPLCTVVESKNQWKCIRKWFLLVVSSVSSVNLNIITWVEELAQSTVLSTQAGRPEFHAHNPYKTRSQGGTCHMPIVQVLGRWRKVDPQLNGQPVQPNWWPIWLHEFLPQKFKVDGTWGEMVPEAPPHAHANTRARAPWPTLNMHTRTSTYTK